MKERQRKDPNEVSFDDYNPRDSSETCILEGSAIPIPQLKDIKPGDTAIWITLINRAGTTITNLVHRSYESAYCQIQLSPDPENGKAHVFILHRGPREKHIAENTVNSIFFEGILPQIVKTISQKNQTGSTINLN